MQPALLRTERPDSPDDQARLMAAFAIRFDGRSYRYNGYGYSQLDDAVTYARLMQLRQSEEDRGRGSAPGNDVEAPTAADRAVMDALSITFHAGVYGHAGFHYDHLADAVLFAETHAARS